MSQHLLDGYTYIVISQSGDTFGEALDFLEKDLTDLDSAAILLGGVCAFGTPQNGFWACQALLVRDAEA